MTGGILVINCAAHQDRHKVVKNVEMKSKQGGSARGAQRASFPIINTSQALFPGTLNFCFIYRHVRNSWKNRYCIHHLFYFFKEKLFNKKKVANLKKGIVH